MKITRYSQLNNYIVNLIEKIKTFLFTEEGEDFVDHQEMGGCQGIVSSITLSFPEVKKVFGEIEVDEPYIDEEGEEQNLMTHHWVEINGIPFDFSKGTLKDYIQFEDIYTPGVENPERYKEIYKG